MLSIVLKSGLIFKEHQLRTLLSEELGCKMVYTVSPIVFLKLNALRAERPLWALIFKEHWGFHVLTITYN